MGVGASRKRSKSVASVPAVKRADVSGGSGTSTAAPAAHRQRRASAAASTDTAVLGGGGGGGAEGAAPETILHEPAVFADTYRQCVKAHAEVVARTEGGGGAEAEEERRLALDALEMLYGLTVRSLSESTGHGVALPDVGAGGGAQPHGEEASSPRGGSSGEEEAGSGKEEAGSGKEEAAPRECAVCMEEACDWPRMQNCGHEPSCRECLGDYMKQRIESGELTPWVLCPQADCCAMVHPEEVAVELSTADLLRFAIGFMRKHLSRELGWVECSTEECLHGVLLYTRTHAHVEEEGTLCPACGTAFAAQQQDDEIQQLVQAGTLRPCPVCEHLTVKDRGMCNVMQCGRCGIWWNWRSREHGRDGRQLKQRSRQNGTMWEPGELEYQRNLERNHPDQFKELLARNGIKYDPSYKRGTS
eukprot:TRINITY_DN536_c0_g1_i1.p1 TRINITY_DN536_c0_g1~~TRINITY_DN536_c0_g1_i1.p1  ORF type:complete len:455 (+),score=152.18 TRINITY_DN536_c0_g1_i1:116-1366(+)